MRRQRSALAMEQPEKKFKLTELIIRATITSHRCEKELYCSRRETNIHRSYSVAQLHFG